MYYLKYLFLFFIVASFVACNNEIDEEDLVCENPIVFFDNLKLSYSTYNGQNKIHLSAPSCDICQIGVEGAEACECKKNCYQGVPAILEECRNDPDWEQCEIDYAYDVYYEGANYSLEEACCPEAIEHEEDCKRDCGDVPAPIRTPIGYTYGVEIWTSSTTILDTPPNTIANDIIVGDQIQGDVSGISFDIGDYLDASTQSFCIVTTLVILYDDGRCCMYKDRMCAEL